jgi:hypothetical protein
MIGAAGRRLMNGINLGARWRNESEAGRENVSAAPRPRRNDARPSSFELKSRHRAMLHGKHASKAMIGSSTNGRVGGESMTWAREDRGLMLHGR